MKPALQRYEEKSSQSNYSFELGTKSLLTIFFALVCVCGMFFAFGYTLGKHAIPATFSLGSAPPPSARSVTPALPDAQAPSAADLGAAESNLTPATLDAPPPPAAASTGASATSPASAAATSAPPAPPALPPVPSDAAAAPDGIFRVQVFAGIQADANSVATALRARGYPALVLLPRPGESDLFYRVHVGPYKSQDEANAARSRLTADGYANAIVVTVAK